MPTNSLAVLFSNNVRDNVPTNSLAVLFSSDVRDNVPTNSLAVSCCAKNIQLKLQLLYILPQCLLGRTTERYILDREHLVRVRDNVSSKSLVSGSVTMSVIMSRLNVW